jgi:hypothetical protein
MKLSSGEDKQKAAFRNVKNGNHNFFNVLGELVSVRK